VANCAGYAWLRAEKQTRQAQIANSKSNEMGFQQTTGVVSDLDAGWGLRDLCNGTRRGCGGPGPKRRNTICEASGVRASASGRVLCRNASKRETSLAGREQHDGTGVQ
jgi:hypothetical protein